MLAVLILWMGSPNLGHGFQSVAKEDLRSRFQNEVAHPGIVISNRLLGHLKKRHIVFVDGIANELAALAGNYFTDNIDAVQDLGIEYS